MTHENNSGIVRLVLTSGQEVRAMGDSGEIAHRVLSDDLVRLEDPGDGRVKYVVAAHVAWVEEETEVE
jgi:hypothetical protein